MRIFEWEVQETGSKWMRSGFVVVLLALLITCGVPAARAQVLYGGLTGNVTDSSGAVIPGAKVNAVSAQTGASYDQATDAQGIYRFPALLPGTYKITISAQGFAGQETLAVPVSLGDISRVNYELKPGNASQEITVTTAPPILQTDTADVHTEITTRDIMTLPIMGSQGGNFQELLRTIPGAGLTSETNSLSGNPQRSINVNMNGMSQQSVSTRIDGALDAYPWLPSNVAYVPPSNAIENVNVATNSFLAEQGNAGGAAVNLQLKSGTNRFHGEFHVLHTDQSLAARNYFQTDIAHFPKKNRNNQYQWGGSLGGPIKRDKVFFFVDYERTTQRQLAGPDVRTLPTPAMINGDFRGLATIYDPKTGNAAGANKQPISCNGVQNMICPSQIDPAAAAMIKLLQPLIGQEVATANNQNNWTGSGTALFNKDNADGKVTYVASQNTLLFGRYSFSRTLAFDPPLLGAADGDATNGGQLGQAPGLVQQAGLGATHTFTPNLLLDWNFGFTRQRLGSTFDLTSAKGLNDLGIPGTNNVGAPGDPSLYYGLPGFIFPVGSAPNSTANEIGASLGNAQPANPFVFRDQQYVTGVNMSWNKHKHALRGGFEWDHSQINHFQPQGGTFQQPRGAFAFNGFATSLAGSTANWYNSWADFLLGLPNTTGKARALFNPNALRWSTYAWYLQDKFQITPKLTLTAGVRWEYYPFGYSDNGKGLRYYNLQTGNVLLGGYGNVPKNDGIDTGIGNFLPRVGVNYSVTPTTVIRGGYGMSADPYSWHVLRNAYPSVLLDTNTPANQANYVPAASLTGLNGTGLGSGSYSVPTGIVLAPLPNLSSGSIALPANAGTTTIPNPFNRGFISSYNATIEQQIGRDVTFTVSYVGTYDLRPVINQNANYSAPGAGTLGGVLSQKFGTNYTGTINVLNPLLHSRYDGLQTTALYRFAGGSNLKLSYTWSKAMSYADNEDLSGMSFPDPNYWRKNYGPAGFDRTNNLQLSGTMALPFGKGEPWLTTGVGSAILGGWLVNPIISVLSGVPFTVGASGNLNANGAGQVADLVAPYRLTHGRPLRSFTTCNLGDPSCSYFNAASFSAPIITSAATAHYGNTNRDEFRGPGYFSADLSILRDFRIREFMTVEVRGDAIGLTNTPHFANPNVTCPGNANPMATPGTSASCATGANNFFGQITATASPGGFFGPDSGARVIWVGASVKF